MAEILIIKNRLSVKMQYHIKRLGEASTIPEIDYHNKRYLKYVQMYQRLEEAEQNETDQEHEPVFQV